MPQNRSSEDLMRELIESGYVPVPDAELRWPSARVYVPLATDVNTPPIPAGAVVENYGQLEPDTARNRKEPR